MEKPCVLSVGTQDCVSWQLTGTAHAFVLPSWKICDRKNAKQYKAKMELFVPFSGPLVRSRERQLFLNLEFFIHEESQYHNIMISCCHIDICIVAKNIMTHRIHEFFIHEESQYHNILISCCSIDIRIVTKKYHDSPVHRCISAAPCSYFFLKFLFGLLQHFVSIFVFAHL